MMQNTFNCHNKRSIRGRLSHLQLSADTLTGSLRLAIWRRGFIDSLGTHDAKGVCVTEDDRKSNENRTTLTRRMERRRREEKVAAT